MPQQLDAILGDGQAALVTEIFIREGALMTGLPLAHLIVAGASGVEITRKLATAGMLTGFFYGYNFARRQYEANMADIEGGS